ncbi:MAG: type II toxin-antitoxin system Phd/YefM family antitoxin [Steroidobacteraceae bacterium]
MKIADKTEIGAYEAKTRLPELLRQVRAGRRYTITNRGEAVADLVPSEAGQMRDHRATIEKFQAYLANNPVRGRVNLRQLIEDGRE